MTPLLTRSRIGQSSILLALALLAGWLCSLQTSWPSLTPLLHSRVAAAIVIAGYFVFCGWMLWPQRIALNRDLHADWHVVHASQTGFALELAQRTAQALRDAGSSVHLHDIGSLKLAQLAGARCLFVVSTTGEGDPPDPALNFVQALMRHPADLHGTHYAVLALGDRNYEHYCAFGRQLDAWLHQHGAQPLFDRVEVDNADPAALRHWQHHVGVLTGHTEQADWAAPRYEHWTLRARQLLNPGCEGNEAWQIELQSPSIQPPHWDAGDIAEIGPRNPPDAATSLLQHIALPHREYSIASLPADGRLQLLVRLMRHDDGTLGLGSGWLCRHAPLGGSIDLRIRSNPNFHPPAPDRPMILIGNGTGLAGLRAHLKARIAAGAHRNWLLFGERHAAHDAFYDEELKQWLQAGLLARLDRVFSRDGGAYHYVQDALQAQASTLREWVDDGAVIYVCGSLQGMAPGVDAVLADTLGAEAVATLLRDGRYRRDVY